MTNLLEDIPDLFVSHYFILIDMSGGVGGWRECEAAVQGGDAIVL